MWRLCKLGYRHEPRLLLAAFSLALLSALPDSLLALWFKLLGDGRTRARLVAGRVCGGRARRVGNSDVVPSDRQHQGSTPIPRQGDNRARIARGDAARLDCHDRAPGAPRVSGSTGRPAQPGIHARPHVHVALHDVCVDPAAGRDRWIARLDSPSARAAAVVCASDRPHVGMAASGREKCVRAWRAGEPTGSASLRHRDDRTCGERSPRHRDRRSPDQRAQARMGVQQPASLRRPMA